MPAQAAGAGTIARRWIATTAATLCSTYLLDLVATAAGVALVASGLLAGADHARLLPLLALSYLAWGLCLRASLAANWALIRRTGTSTCLPSKLAHDLVRRVCDRPRARRLAAAAGYVGTELAKEAPYYGAAFGALFIAEAVSPADAFVFLAGANLGAAAYELALARGVRAFLGHADFDTDWDPRAYLAGYYARVEPDERETIAFFVDGFRRTPEGGSVLVFGIGPTLHHVFPAAERAGEIHLGEYLPANRAEAGRWLAGDPGRPRLAPLRAPHPRLRRPRRHRRRRRRARAARRAPGSPAFSRSISAAPTRSAPRSAPTTPSSAPTAPTAPPPTAPPGPSTCAASRPSSPRAAPSSSPPSATPPATASAAPLPERRRRRGRHARRPRGRLRCRGGDARSARAAPAWLRRHRPRPCRQTSRDCSSAARTKSAKSGWGAKGFDFSSGWNWTPMNHGWPGISTISGRRPSGERPEKRSPQLLELVAVGDVDLVAVAVALGDRRGARRCPPPGCRRRGWRRRRRGAWCRPCRRRPRA